ncbi:MAG: SgcJ/EcaC family oxidoreductase [Acidobacteriota bacterium]|nr:SgcJ/EcaC family oxidoreductase [Acidobacteriota bacterium]
MSSQTSPSKDAPSADETEVKALYRQLLECWNHRDAAAFAALYEQDGACVGFDGSQMNGRPEIELVLSQIFAEHQTPPYVGKIREVRFLTSEVTIVRAVAGMVPPGKSDLDPALNALQSLVASRREGSWRIALFQNTPVQFHGRPELVQQVTDELRQLL